MLLCSYRLDLVIDEAFLSGAVLSYNVVIVVVPAGSGWLGGSSGH